MESTVSPEEVRRQLGRIFGSEGFQRSRRLREFLQYITHLTLDGRQDEINEFLIGVDVFGRGQNYNPSEDSVVRRQAHSLRQKLDDYYNSDGAQDPIVVEVPLGHYIPVFRRSAGSPAQERPESEVSAADFPPRLLGWPSWILVTVGVAAISFVAGQLTVDSPTSARSDEIQSSSPVIELWKPWLAADTGPVIVFSSPLTGVVKHF